MVAIFQQSALCFPNICSFIEPKLGILHILLSKIVMELKLVKNRHKVFTFFFCFLISFF